MKKKLAISAAILVGIFAIAYLAAIMIGPHASARHDRFGECGKENPHLILSVTNYAPWRMAIGETRIDGYEQGIARAVFFGKWRINRTVEPASTINICLEAIDYHDGEYEQRDDHIYIVDSAEFWRSAY